MAVAAAISPGASIDGWFAGVVVAVGMTVITTAASTLLAIDDDETWQRNVLRRQARRAGAIASDVPGVIFLEIDGLAYEVLRRALRDGNAPVMARWLREDGYRLERWETDWSSQTGACQAGLLHGDNDDMPAFRWWEKDRGRAIVTNHPRDAQELERRHSDGRGLLHEDGASRANILSGDAPHSMLTMSTVLVRGRGALGRDYAAYFARPYAVAHTGLLAFADYVRERRAAARQVRDDVQPRIPRPRMYALVRAWATVVQRDLQVSAIVGDMMAGRPVVYSTFLAYDEVAHHSGIERHDTLAVLRQVDRQLARVKSAVADAPRPYELVVLSDHGQSQGATFEDRYGVTLENLVREACGAGRVEAHSGGEDEALAYLGAGLTEVADDPTMTGRAVASATRGRRAGGAVTLEPGARAELEQGDELPEIVVMASGCLGLVSFPREPGRVTLERLAERYPGPDPGAPRAPRHRVRARALSGARRGRPRRARDPPPRRGAHRGRGSAGAVRSERRGARTPDRRVRALSRPARQRRLLAGYRGGRRLRGARRLARRDGREPVVPVRPLPECAALSRARGGRRRAPAPRHAPLAGRVGPRRLSRRSAGHRRW